MTVRPHIVLTKSTHRKHAVVKFGFDYHRGIIDHLKQNTPARWSATMYCWYLFEKDFNLHTIFELFKDVAYIDYSALKSSFEQSDLITTTQKPNYQHRKTTVIPEGYLQLMLQRRMSENTIRVYTAYFKDFCYVFKDYDLTDITKDDINNFIVKLIKKYDISESQQDQRINSIKFYYEQVLCREKEYYHIDRPKRTKKLPEVLSKGEVFSIIKTTINIKHKSIISMLYSTGMRRGELQNVKKIDIDSKRMLIKVIGKGKKERYVPLSENVLNLLRKYIKKDKPQKWLFEGDTPGKAISLTTIWNIIKQAAARTGIQKRVYPHIFRHSFATHQIEAGIDLRLIQVWLGHESSKTTEIYTHVSEKLFSKFKTPIDDMDIT